MCVLSGECACSWKQQAIELSVLCLQVMADATLENSKLPELITEALVLKRKARATTVAQQ